jgi:hypothetical protein
MDAAKIVGGSPQFMGTIVCQYHAETSTISCAGNARKQDDWEFHISGYTMTGTLTVGAEKRLYRRITVRKEPTKAN